MQNAWCSDSIPFFIKGGLNIAKVRYGVDVGQMYKFGFIGGIGMDFEFNNMPFEIDILYAQKGRKFSIAGTDPFWGEPYESEGTLKLDYITIPVIYKMKKEFAGRNFYGGAGLAPGILLLARENWTYTTLGETMKYSGKPQFNKNLIDLGLIVTLGVEISKFLIETKINYGLTDIFSMGTSKNLSFAFMSGYKFKYQKNKQLEKSNLTEENNLIEDNSLAEDDNSESINHENLNEGIKAYKTKQYMNGITFWEKIPDNSIHYKEAQNYIDSAKTELSKKDNSVEKIENKLSKKNKGKITEESLEQYLLEGMKLYKIGKYEEAISVWEKIPENSKYYAKAQKYIKTAETKLIEIKNEK